MQDLNQFRLEVRAWLEANCPASQRQPMKSEEQYWGGRRGAFASADAQLWFERMRDKGWTAPEWPTQYGGGGLSAQQARVLKEEMKSLHARTPLFGIGLWMLGPAVLEYGNEQQKQQHIRAIVNGESRWCQGYSEPGAGSDLASLQCKAEDMGDHFLVNGSKIWTTAADKCDWIFCLVRTDPNVKKQEGISFLLIDMDDPGVSTTPIALISGESEFCQTFFDNVKVPKENLVGELNKGWSVAKALLVHERKLMAEIGSDSPRQVMQPNMAAREYLEFDNGKIADAHLRNALVEYDMLMQAVGLTHFRAFEEKAQRRAQCGAHGDEIRRHGSGKNQKRIAAGHTGQPWFGLGGGGKRFYLAGNRHTAPVGHVQGPDHRRWQFRNSAQPDRPKSSRTAAVLGAKHSWHWY